MKNFCKTFCITLKCNKKVGEDVGVWFLSLLLEFSNLTSLVVHKSCERGCKFYQFVMCSTLGHITLRFGVSHSKSPPC